MKNSEGFEGTHTSLAEFLQEFFKFYGSPSSVFKMIELPSLARPPYPIPCLKSQDVILAEKFRDSCVTKGIISYIAGFGLGALFGLLMDGSQVVDEKTSFKKIFKDSLYKSLSTGRNFAAFGFAFAISECCIESYRGSTDKLNPILAGCATGGAVGFRVNAKAGAFGCASVAAFTSLFEFFISG
ncbi:mitochondrial import inner membrane translocase subunit Tim22-like isoform X2 [Zophobas morio]|uniref:mitochondrial import inner membrane translocase subunit Tim22-like isoform X2 n=1 Tax=Zophobas morio TaxID=2755281 RepID=UPI003082C030